MKCATCGVEFYDSHVCPITTTPTQPIITWPQQKPQRQDSLTDQLTDLHRMAARFGMFDAADWLWKRMREGGLA